MRIASEPGVIPSFYWIQMSHDRLTCSPLPSPGVGRICLARLPLAHQVVGLLVLDALGRGVGDLLGVIDGFLGLGLAGFRRGLQRRLGVLEALVGLGPVGGELVLEITL